MSKFKGGNFSLVAHNVTEIYAILKYRYPHCFPNKKIMVATAGIINALEYIKNEKIDPQFIIAIPEHITSSDDIKDDYQQDIELLSFFLLWFEVKVFSIDTKINSRDLLEIVHEKLNVISDSVSKTMSKARKDKNFKSSWRSLVTAFMNLSDFKSLRDLIGIININRKRDENCDIQHQNNESSSKEKIDILINEIHLLTVNTSDEYTQKLFDHLNPVSLTPVYFEVVLYFLYHLDYYIVQNNYNQDFRKYVIGVICRNISRVLEKHCKGDITEVINERFSLYGDVTRRNKFGSNEFHQDLYFHYIQLLNNAKMRRNSLVQWGKGDFQLDMNAVDNHVLQQFVIDLDEEYLGKFINTLNNLFNKEITSLNALKN